MLSEFSRTFENKLDTQKQTGSLTNYVANAWWTKNVDGLFGPRVLCQHFPFVATGVMLVFVSSLYLSSGACNTHVYKCHSGEAKLALFCES